MVNVTRQSFFVLVFKEPDYNIMMMSTFLVLTVSEGQKEEIKIMNGELVKFKYPEGVTNH